MTNAEPQQELLDNQLPEHTNINLIYEYTEYHLKSVNRSIDILTTKLNVLLGLSTALVVPIALLLPIGIKTKFQCYWLLSLEIMSCGLLIATLYFCITGFQPRSLGGVTPPSLLMNENYYDSDEDIRLIITKTRIEALKELEDLRDWKASVVNQIVILLFVTIVCEIVGLIGATWLTLV